MNYFPDEVVEHIFGFLLSNRDHNSVSLVCKSWFKVERWSRNRVFIGNCYSIAPDRVIDRFPELKSLTLKGKPHFADFNLVPYDWGGFLQPWIEAMVRRKVGLEELRLKRMVVTDECLELIAKSFPNFKALVLDSCEGFTTDGLAAIASHCRFLRELDLQENEIEDPKGQWLSCFPESCTSLVSLNFACLRGEVNVAALERLVARCPNLKSLRLNRAVHIDTLQKILTRAPQLEDLGTGSYDYPESEWYSNLMTALEKCTSIKSLSGFLDAAPLCLPAIYPICSKLTSLNLSYAPGVYCDAFTKLIQHCKKLQRLWILDSMGDTGLAAVASSCKELQELRVFPSDFQGMGIDTVTEEGLVAISIGCPKLHSLLYFCQQMTNAALKTVAKNCPNFTRFRLCILDPQKPDPVTNLPLDDGFGAIVQSCKGLRRLSLTGLLTDRVFLYIGTYAKQLEMLSIAFAGDTDKSMLYVLNGCKKMRKLEIRDSPFGNTALLADVGKYLTMRSLWMSSCEVTLGGCKAVAKMMPMLNVEIINDNDPTDIIVSDDAKKVDKMYLYRTLDGPRNDAPEYVWNL